MPVEPDDRQDRAAVLDDLAVADLLDRVGAHLLEPGDGVERDRDPPAAADGREQHPLPLGLGDCGGLGRARARAPVGRSSRPQRPAGQGLHVEDQRDRAVTEDGRAGVEADRLELAADRLDDDLLGVDDPVDDEAEAPPSACSTAMTTWPSCRVGRGPSSPSTSVSRTSGSSSPRRR